MVDHVDFDFSRRNLIALFSEEGWWHPNHKLATTILHLWSHLNQTPLDISPTYPNHQHRLLLTVTSDNPQSLLFPPCPHFLVSSLNLITPLTLNPCMKVNGPLEVGALLKTSNLCIYSGGSGGYSMFWALFMIFCVTSRTNYLSVAHSCTSFPLDVGSWKWQRETSYYNGNSCYCVSAGREWCVSALQSKWKSWTQNCMDQSLHG